MCMYPLRPTRPRVFLMLPRADTIELAMSVDDALKYIISMGWWCPAGLLTLTFDKTYLTTSLPWAASRYFQGI